MPGSITTHSLPALGAKTQQLVANIGAAKESISKLFTPSFTLIIGAIDAHTMGQGSLLPYQSTLDPRLEGSNLLSIAPTT